MAVAAEGHGVSVHEVATGERIFTIDEPQRQKAQFAAGGCALSPDGNVLVGSFRTSNRAHGQLHVLRWRNTTVEARVFQRDYSIWQCNISDDASRIAFKYWKGSESGLELVDARSGTTIGRWGGVTGEWDFAMDATASKLVTADSRALRVLTIDDGDGEGVQVMKSYTFSAFAGCDISADGGHVVSPMADHKFGIWNTNSGKLVAILAGHKNRSNGCAISADGTRVLTCSNDHTVRLWDTRGATSDEGGDEIRNTLRVLLAGDSPDEQVHKFVLKEIQECQVNDAFELLQAHAALVMAMRSSVAVHDLESSKAIRESAAHIYSSVGGKLHDKPQVQLGQVVMAHAEQRGLVPRGFPNRHMGTYYKLPDKAIRKLRDNVQIAWDEVAPLPEDENVDEELASQLNRLHEQMNIGPNHVGRELYPSIAACSLLLWPDVINKKATILRDRMKPRTIKSMLFMGGDKQVAGIELIMPFDISSPRVLQHLLRKNFVQSLPSRHRHLVNTAVSKSSFKNLESVESELSSLIDKLARAKHKKPSVFEIDINDDVEPEQSFDDEDKEEEDVIGSSTDHLPEHVRETREPVITQALKTLEPTSPSQHIAEEPEPVIEPIVESVHSDDVNVLADEITHELAEDREDTSEFGKESGTTDTVQKENDEQTKVHEIVVTELPVPTTENESETDTLRDQVLDSQPSLSNQNEDADRVSIENYYGKTLDDDDDDVDNEENNIGELKSKESENLPSETPIVSDDNVAQITQRYLPAIEIYDSEEKVENRDITPLGRHRMSIEKIEVEKDPEVMEMKHSTSAAANEKINSATERVPPEGATVVVRSVRVEQINETIITGAPKSEDGRKGKPQQITELKRSSAIKQYVPEIPPSIPIEVSPENDIPEFRDLQEPQIEISPSNFNLHNPIVESVEDEEESQNVEDIPERIERRSFNKQIDNENLEAGELNENSGAVGEEVDLEAGTATKDLARKARRKRRRQRNLVLGVVAIASFFICAALLTLVVLRAR